LFALGCGEWEKPTLETTLCCSCLELRLLEQSDGGGDPVEFEHGTDDTAKKLFMLGRGELDELLLEKTLRCSCPELRLLEQNDGDGDPVELEHGTGDRVNWIDALEFNDTRVLTLLATSSTIPQAFTGCTIFTSVRTCGSTFGNPDGGKALLAVCGDGCTSDSFETTD